MCNCNKKVRKNTRVRKPLTKQQQISNQCNGARKEIQRTITKLDRFKKFTSGEKKSLLEELKKQLLVWRAEMPSKCPDEDDLDTTIKLIDDEYSKYFK